MRAFLRAYRTQALVSLGSLLAVLWIPFVNRSRHGDLSDWYSDHIHHPFATWVALKKGLLIYTVQFQQIWDNSGYPLEAKAWGEMPGMVYPPGVFVVFTPTMLLGKFVPMTLQTFGVINIVYLLILTHLAFFAVLVTFKEAPRGSRAMSAIIIWMFFASLASEGFYDAVFFGAGAMVVLELIRKRPGPALIWLSVGALLHFRMAAFAPLGLYALWLIFKERKEKPIPWKALIIVTLSAALCLWTFWLAYETTLPFQASHPPVLGTSGRTLRAVVILSVIVAGVCLYFADIYVAMIVGVCLVLCITERQPYWWHAAILFAPVIAVGVTGKARNASVARAVLVAWAVSIAPIVWRDPAFQLLRTFLIAFKT